MDFNLDYSELVALRDEIYKKIKDYENSSESDYINELEYESNNQHLSKISDIIYEKKENCQIDSVKFGDKIRIKRKIITHSEANTTAKNLTNVALKLSNHARYFEALILINIALEYDSEDYIIYNTKAIILEKLSKFELAVKCYSKALKLNPECSEIKINMIYSMHDQAMDLLKINPEKSLKIIEDLIENIDVESAYSKSSLIHDKIKILKELNRPVEAYELLLISKGDSEKLDAFKKKVELFKKYTDETLINITNHYRDLNALKRGSVVSLKRDPDNEYDRDAIKVELGFESVGYVANSRNTLLEYVKSASEIKDIIESNQKAEVLFSFMNQYVIARLINENTELINDKFKDANDLFDEMDRLIDSVKDYE